MSKCKAIDHKALFEALPVPRFLVDVRKGKVFVLTEVNAQAESYFKTSKDKLAGKELKSFLDEESARFFQQSLETALAQKKPVSFKVSSAMAEDSSFGGFWVNPILNDKGQVTILDVMAVPGGADASSLQRERDDAISLLTSVFDVSEVGIIVSDRHGRIIRVNDSFVRIYGWDRDELIGREFVDLVAEDEREDVRKDQKEFMVSGVRGSGEMRVMRKDSNEADVLYTTATLDLSHGRRFQVTTIMDITLRKQMEVNLRHAKEQADSSNQAKSTFLANMSHELRTPLNAIIGFSEMMIKGTFGDLENDRYKEYMDDIHLSARHLLDIINEVLDMSKIEAGRVELDEEFFHIKQLVDSVARIMDSRAFSSGVKIIEDIQDDLPPLYADPRLVRQILINLVGNAVKFTSDGGTVSIQVFLTAEGSMHIVVTDTGKGIPADLIQDALEPFGQIGKPPEEAGDAQGTGLGLPLAKAMTELHGGKLLLESELEKGTRVTVVFPVERVDSAGKSKKKSGKKPALPRKSLHQ